MKEGPDVEIDYIPRFEGRCIENMNLEEYITALNK